MSAACLPTQESVVHLESDVDAAVALLTVGGIWDESLWRSATSALHDCLAQQPEALIVDLSGLDDPGVRSAPCWVAARRTAAAMEPPVELALCIPPHLALADRMQRLSPRLYLPVYARVRQARVAISGRLPQTERLVLTLCPDPEAPSIARNFVGDACLAWGMPELLYDGRTVMSELITNAVEHARTEMLVVVSRRGDGLHISVADLVTDPPRLVERRRVRRDRPLDERGMGLRLVEAAATAWGSLPTRTGKVVWATLRPRLPEPRQPRHEGSATGPR